jgi:hypothetical protein
MAAFLTTVGRSSPVNINTTPNAKDDPAFPINAKATVNHCKSKDKNDDFLQICVKFIKMLYAIENQTFTLFSELF